MATPNSNNSFNSEMVDDIDIASTEPMKEELQKIKRERANSNKAANSTTTETATKYDVPFGDQDEDYKKKLNILVESIFFETTTNVKPFVGYYYEFNYSSYVSSVQLSQQLKQYSFGMNAFKVTSEVDHTWDTESVKVTFKPKFSRITTGEMKPSPKYGYISVKCQKKNLLDEKASDDNISSNNDMMAVSKWQVPSLTSVDDISTCFEKTLEELEKSYTLCDTNHVSIFLLPEEGEQCINQDDVFKPLSHPEAIPSKLWTKNFPVKKYSSISKVEDYHQYMSFKQISKTFNFQQSQFTNICPDMLKDFTLNGIVYHLNFPILPLPEVIAQKLYQGLDDAKKLLKNPIAYKNEERAKCQDKDENAKSISPETVLGEAEEKTDNNDEFKYSSFTKTLIRLNNNLLPAATIENTMKHLENNREILAEYAEFKEIINIRKAGNIEKKEFVLEYVGETQDLLSERYAGITGFFKSFFVYCRLLLDLYQQQYQVEHRNTPPLFRIFTLQIPGFGKNPHYDDHIINTLRQKYVYNCLKSITIVTNHLGMAENKAKKGTISMTTQPDNYNEKYNEYYKLNQKDIKDAIDITSKQLLSSVIMTNDIPLLDDKLSKTIALCDSELHNLRLSKRDKCYSKFQHVRSIAQDIIFGLRSEKERKPSEIQLQELQINLYSILEYLSRMYLHVVKSKYYFFSSDLALILSELSNIPDEKHYYLHQPLNDIDASILQNQNNADDSFGAEMAETNIEVIPSRFKPHNLDLDSNSIGPGNHYFVMTVDCRDIYNTLGALFPIVNIDNQIGKIIAIIHNIYVNLTHIRDAKIQGNYHTISKTESYQYQMQGSDYITFKYLVNNSSLDTKSRNRLCRQSLALIVEAIRIFILDYYNSDSRYKSTQSITALLSDREWLKESLKLIGSQGKKEKCYFSIYPTQHTKNVINASGSDENDYEPFSKRDIFKCNISHFPATLVDEVKCADLEGRVFSVLLSKGIITPSESA